MATTPLRSYIREIETLIDQGNVDEAIAHARHILTILPKNLSAYRMLGKAFLESQRFGDASDLFMRVLSAVPDDFVSHVGMSIIREDEGHLDAAIWHMERAFEVQPYNSAIQDELRRLYGRRDGVEPHKVRLTRGALARMYARGDLYQQAMTELRSALLEDPQRTDLQVLLARMYYLSGQKVEAVEVCSKLLKKLPNCLEANRIIAAILPETERKDEAPAYQNRVAALDPYLVQSPPRSTEAEDIPEHTVTVDRLDTAPGQALAEPGQPTWASSLGVSIEPFGAPKDSLPDWLTQEDESEAERTDEDEIEEGITEDESIPVFPKIHGDEAESGMPDETELPDWMKEAGWEEPGKGAITSLESLQPDDERESADSELSQSGIPDWLKDMAPPGTLSEDENLEIEEADGDLFPWMEDEIVVSEQAASEESSQEDMEAWTTGGNGDERQAEEIPDWLSGTDDEEEPLEADADLYISEQGELPDVAARLEPDIQDEDGAREEKAEAEVKSDFELPDWLADIEPASRPASEATPEWLVDSQAQGEPQVGEGFELPDWLAGIQTEAEEPEDGRIVDPAQPEALEGRAEVDTEAELAEAELETEFLDALETEAEEELPDWLKDMEMPGEPAAEATLEEAELEAEFEAALETETEEELPDWLKEMERPGEPAAEAASEEAELEAEFEAALETETKEELPDWLKEMETPGEPAAEAAPEEAELEAEFEAALETETEEELPDWLKEMEMPGEPAAEAAPEEAELEAEFEAALETETEEELPDWLKEMETLGEPAAEAAPEEAELEAEFEAALKTETEEELPDWLKEMEMPAEPAAEAAPEEAELEAEYEAALETETEEELPDWLKEMEMPAGPAAEEKPDKAPWESELAAGQFTDELPDWLGDVGTTEDLKEEQLPEIELSDTQPVKIQAESGPPSDQDAQVQHDAEEQQDVEEQHEAIEQHDAIEQHEAEEPREAEEAVSSELVDDDAAMAWLEGLAAKHGVPEEELITRAEDRLDVMPDWMSEPEPEVEPAAARPDEALYEAEPVQEELPAVPEDEELEFDETPAVGLVEPVAEDEEAEFDETPAVEVVEPEAEEKAVEEGSFIDLPDWLLAIDDAADQIETAEAETTVAEFSPPAPPEAVPVSEAEDIDPLPSLDFEDEDEAMAWLEGLAAKHGVPEEELITKPEERPAETPEWIQEIQEEEVQEDEAPETEAVEIPKARTGFDWQIEEEAPAAVQETEAEPDYIEAEEPVQEEAQPAGAVSAEVEPEEVEQVEAAGEEVPTWLQEMVREDEPESGVSDWLDDIEDEALFEEDEEVEKPAEIPDWLKKAEATLLDGSDRTIDEVTSLAEAQLIEVSPEDIAEEETEVEALVQPEISAEADQEVESPDLPGWLEDLEDEEPADELELWEQPQSEEESLPIIPEKVPSPALDLNKASLIELEETPGIGFRLAQRIVEHRQTSGPFQDLQDLVLVPGVNQELISELSSRLFVTEPVEGEADLTAEARPEGAGPEWDIIAEARSSIKSSPEEGLDRYNDLIQKELMLEEIASDLKTHLQDDPGNFKGWISLGDALNRLDRPKEALEAYIKAEQLLR
jgi:Flp pilus assembly protein TadD